MLNDGWPRQGRPGGPHGTGANAGPGIIGGALNTPKMGRGTAAAWLLLAMLAIAPPAGACIGTPIPRYELKDLGTLGGAASVAEGLNNLGQVVGLSQITGSTLFHAFVWDASRLRDLGTLGGPQSGARAINVHGDIVGWAHVANNDKHAFLYHAGQMTDLGTLAGSPVDAYSLNDAGVLAGSYINGMYERAFMWTGGTMQDIGTLGGTDSRAYSVNGHGDVVGFARPVDDSQMHACLWRNGTVTDLGTLGGWASYAYDINDNGKVVGWSLEDPNVISHAFEWSEGVMIDLGSLGGKYSAAFAINLSGLAAGVSSDTADVNHAVIWEGGQIQDLNALIAPGSGWFLSSASDVNDQGQIVGYGTYQGATRAFLLSPLPALDAPQPKAALSFAGATPNPAPGAATFRFSLDQTAHVRLRIYDVRGRLIASLADREFGAGPGVVAWDGREATGALAGAGLYWARFEAGARAFTRSFALLR